MRPQSKTFSLTLAGEEASILAVTASGKIEVYENRIELLDSHGYRIAEITLAQDTKKREIV